MVKPSLPYNATAGPFTLTVTERPSTCGSAPELQAGTAAMGTTVGMQGLQGSVCGGADAGEALYRYAHPSDGPLQLDVTAAFDAMFDWFDRHGYRATDVPWLSYSGRGSESSVELQWAYEPGTGSTR